jgi:hypothetical protein
VKFCAIDRTGLVSIEVPEDVLPVLDILPESRELQVRCKKPEKTRFERIGTDFVESDGSTAVGIKYRHQEPNGVEIEGYAKCK